MRNRTSTKAGPGRLHKAGHKKAKPVASKGAPAGFVQHTNPERNARRRAIRAMGGIRQWKLAANAHRDGLANMVEAV